jgi:hypothetical protein
MPQTHPLRFFFVRQLMGFGRRRLAVLLWLAMFGMTCYAQGNFVSGSTGADGAFNPTDNQTLQLPESGVFNFTTVNIPEGVTIRFGHNSRNTPVTILATGNVTIAGTIDVSGSAGVSGLGGIGGPGGFSGGSGGPSTNGSQLSAGVNGDGPGGGGASGSSSQTIRSAGGGGFGNPGFPGSSQDPGVVNGAGGPKYGLPTLLPLIGGSGGGVRLIANVISGNMPINAGGGFGGSSGGNGGGGYVRIEAFDLNSLNISIQGGPSPHVSTATPGTVTPSNLPVIRIVSVAGIAPPNQPGGSLQDGPDIILPSNQSNPVTVSLSASNIPLGTTLQVTMTPENGARLSAQSTALSGTLASSTATASISLPDGISVIQAAGTIDVGATNQPVFVGGERVKRIEVSAIYGGGSVITYITESGKRIKAPQ